MEKEKLAVEWVSIERLFPNPANPRRNDDAVPHVAASLRRFGWQQPVVAKPSGEVIAGHTRLKAALSLGMTDMPVVWFTGSDLDATAFNIADNRSHEFSSWSEPDLAKLLEELRAEDSLDGVGYSVEDIDTLLAELQDQADKGFHGDPDEIPEPPDDAVTRPGDLWVMGKHRVLCGDSAKVEDVDRLLCGANIQLINSDPPYGVRVEPRSNNAIAAGLSSFQVTHHQKLDIARHPEKAHATHRRLRAKDRPLQNDFVSEQDFNILLQAWFGNMARVLEPGRGFYIWGGYGNLGNYPPALKAAGLYFSQGIVWTKGHPVLTRKDFMGNFELAFYGWREGAAHKFFGPNNAIDVWDVKKINPQSMTHLTEKPTELARRAIEYSSQKGECVLDLFGGSGSTLIACEELGRKGFLMEIDTLYMDLIVSRWEKFTQKPAILEGTKKTFTEITKERVSLP